MCPGRVICDEGVPNCKRRSSGCSPPRSMNAVKSAMRDLRLPRRGDPPGTTAYFPGPEELRNRHVPLGRAYWGGPKGIPFNEIGDQRRGVRHAFVTRKVVDIDDQRSV